MTIAIGRRSAVHLSASVALAGTLSLLGGTAHATLLPCLRVSLSLYLSVCLGLIFLLSFTSVILTPQLTLSSNVTVASVSLRVYL